jgi:hypothetical protein
MNSVDNRYPSEKGRNAHRQLEGLLGWLHHEKQRLQLMEFLLFVELMLVNCLEGKRVSSGVGNNGERLNQR